MLLILKVQLLSVNNNSAAAPGSKFNFSTPLAKYCEVLTTKFYPSGLYLQTHSHQFFPSTLNLSLTPAWRRDRDPHLTPSL